MPSNWSYWFVQFILSSLNLPSSKQSRFLRRIQQEDSSSKTMSKDVMSSHIRDPVKHRIPLFFHPWRTLHEYNPWNVWIPSTDHSFGPISISMFVMDAGKALISSPWVAFARICLYLINYNYYFLLLHTCLFSWNRGDRGKHSLIIRTKAKTEFILKDCDLDQRELVLKCIIKHYPHEFAMKLLWDWNILNLSSTPRTGQKKRKNSRVIINETNQMNSFSSIVMIRHPSESILDQHTH